MQNLNSFTLNKIVLIGASTGGPGEIEKIIKELPLLRDTTIIIAQHMAVDFLPSFTKRLQKFSINPISIAKDNEILKNSNIYICNAKTLINKKNNELIFQIISSPNNKYNPDINAAFNSIAKFTKELNVFCIILTGIGDDGVEGCKQLSLMGARTATQNAASAIVDGMPNRARMNVQNIEVYNTQQIKDNIKEFCS